MMCTATQASLRGKLYQDLATGVCEASSRHHLCPKVPLGSSLVVFK